VILTEHPSISPAKVEALKARIRQLNIDVSKISESFTRGSGKGGQKINKTSNAVQLFYAPLNISVKCQRERQRSVNRFLALRELVDEIEMMVSPSTSLRLKERNRVKKQKDRRRRRAAN
jgi:protein subunit release factor B